jgi:pilus assembly protein Flp/PilA
LLVILNAKIRLRVHLACSNRDEENARTAGGLRVVNQGVSSMRILVRSFLSDECGASAAEYALILAIVGAAIATAATSLGTAIAGALTSAATRITTP